MASLSAGRRLFLQSRQQQQRWIQTTSKALADPSRYVTGVTLSDIESNPSLAAYFKANFPEWQSEDTITTRPIPTPPPPIDPLVALNIRPLSCQLRDPVKEEGSRACYRLRRNKLIPGLLYGSDPTKNILSIDHSSKVMIKTHWDDIFRETQRYKLHFENRVYELSVHDEEGNLVQDTPQLVVPRDVQWHPVKNLVICANYIRYYPGKPIKIPIKYINEEESPAMKRGGFIAPVSRTVECVVEEGVRIPEFVELECTGVRLKDVLRTERLIFPEGVKASHRVSDSTFLVGTVFGRRGDADDDK